MKAYIKILVFSMLVVSCQSNKKEDNSLSTKLEKETTQKKRTDTSNKLQPKIILTEAQFKNFFPKEIGAYKLINVSVLMSSAVASAMYVKDNDYNHSMTYNLEDCNRKGSANIRNFEDSYNIKPQGPKGTEYIYTERDGYKTIAFLQPKIGHINIRFIYNNRFRLSLGGFESDDALWNYFQKEDLKKLDN